MAQRPSAVHWALPLVAVKPQARRLLPGRGSSLDACSLSAWPSCPCCFPARPGTWLCRGSSVLPLPFAFSRLGVLPGLVLMLAVALANALVGTLLLRCASSLDKHSFEGLAEAAGGPSWKVRSPTSRA